MVWHSIKGYQHYKPEVLKNPYECLLIEGANKNKAFGTNNCKKKICHNGGYVYLPKLTVSKLGILLNTQYLNVISSLLSLNKLQKCNEKMIKTLNSDSFMLFFVLTPVLVLKPLLDPG